MAEESKVYIIMEGYNREIAEIIDKTFSTYNAARDYLVKRGFESLCNDGAWVQIATIDESQVAQMENDIGLFMNELEKTRNYHSVMYCNIGNTFLDPILYKNYQKYTIEELDEFIIDVCDLVAKQCEDADEVLTLSKDDFSMDKWEELLKYFNKKVVEILGYNRKKFRSIPLEDVNIYEGHFISIRLRKKSLAPDLCNFAEANKKFFITDDANYFEKIEPTSFNDGISIIWRKELKNPYTTNISKHTFEDKLHNEYEDIAKNFVTEYENKVIKFLQEFIKMYNISTLNDVSIYVSYSVDYVDPTGEHGYTSAIRNNKSRSFKKFTNEAEE